MKNWKTTLIGGLVAGLIAGVDLLKTGGVSAENIIMAFGIAFLGALSKDFNVSHTQDKKAE